MPRRDNDTKILDELRKSMNQGTPENNEKTYTFRQYTIDGRVYSTLADLKNHEIKVETAEEAVIAGFAKMLSESSEPQTRDFTRTVKNIGWLHQNDGDDLKATPLYKVAKEVGDKALATAARSVERDMLLLLSVEQIKTAYRALMQENVDD